MTALLSYDKTFGDHSIGLMAGATKEQYTADYIQAYRREYISTAIDQPFFGGATKYGRKRVQSYQVRLLWTCNLQFSGKVSCRISLEG